MSNTEQEQTADHILFSTYPLTEDIVERIRRKCGVDHLTTQVLTHLRRIPTQTIYKKLRSIHCDTLWIAVSNHGYQPFLSILLLLGSLTRARRIRVTDFVGEHYPVTRFYIISSEPLRLLLGSLHGLGAIVRAHIRCRILATIRRSPQYRLSSRPRLAYLKTNLWFGLQAGGSIGHTIGVANAFARLGCQVHLISAESIPTLDSTISVNLIGGRASTGIPLETANYIFQDLFLTYASRYFRSVKPELLYQRYCLSNFSGVLLSLKLGIPLILEYNGSEVWIADHWGSRLTFKKSAQLIEKLNLQYADLIVVVSEVLKEELVSKGIPRGKILCHPNCIDEALFNPERFSARERHEIRSRLGIPSDALVCTFIGTFGPWHGVDIMAETACQMADTMSSWVQEHKLHFLFLGDGERMAKVRQILNTVPAKYWTLAGLVPQESAPAFLAASDVFLSPHVQNPDGTRFFGSPTKLFEYMAMGKPIIASDLEQIGAILHNGLRINALPAAPPSPGDSSLGILTAPGAKTDLVLGLRFLAEHPDWRVHLGRNARTEVCTKHTWNHYVSAVLSALQSLGEAGNRGTNSSS